MRRQARAALLLLAIAGPSACSGTGAASSTHSAPGAVGPAPSALVVTPRSGGPATSFTFTFKAPDSSGVMGKTRLGYTLSVIGPARAGCVAARSSSVPSVAKGATVSLGLVPARLGGRWCPGTFRAQVTEVQTPVCAPGTMCPQYIRVVGVVARTTFRVSA